MLSIHLQASEFTSGHSSDASTPNKAPDPTGVGGSSPQPATVKNVGNVRSLIGRTIADVERDMIIDTLGHCLGNRTHAANILLSIRTLRNKLSQYKDEGVDVPPAVGGSL